MSIVAGVSKRFNPDRIGVVASILCAIHCALTPILLIVLPSFGQLWSHPASHWGMAIFVVPIAAAMISVGYRKHRRSWVVLTGVLGIMGVIIGAIIPYVEDSGDTVGQATSIVEQDTNLAAETSEDSEVFVWKVRDEPLEVEPEEEVFVWHAGEELGPGCVDSCCPSLQRGADGKLRLHIPLASIVTTLGGIALIVTHLGNLCCCSGCKGKDRLRP